MAQRAVEIYAQRENGMLRNSLLGRHSILLQLSALTFSARALLTERFDDHTVIGLKRDDPNEGTESYAWYSRLLRWQEPLTRGIFLKSEAEEIDALLYRGLLIFQLGQVTAQNDPDIQRLLQDTRERGALSRVAQALLIQTLDPKEQEERKANQQRLDKKIDEKQRKLAQREDKRKEMLRNWPLQHYEQFDRAL